MQWFLLCIAANFSGFSSLDLTEYLITTGTPLEDSLEIVVTTDESTLQKVAVIHVSTDRFYASVCYLN